MSLMNLIDLHCDTISKLLASDEQVGLADNNYCVDLEKLQQANSLAQFFALFVDLKEQVAAETNPLEYCLTMLDKFYQEVDAHCGLELARSFTELKVNQAAEKISAFLTIEEGGVLQGQLSNLRNFYRLGVRGLTLTWQYPNGIGYPNTSSQYQERGLTPFGRQVVEEMNRLGMLIDVSHLSDQGVYEAVQLSTAPVIASHSNARAVKDHFRNLTDDLIKLIAESGGVIGINFVPEFLGRGKVGRIKDVVRHIKHIKQVGGSEVIALGSDFDGFTGSSELRNIGQIEKLWTELKTAGFTEEELEKIWFKNCRRVIKDVLRGDADGREV